MNIEKLSVERSEVEARLKEYGSMNKATREADPRYAVLEKTYGALMSGSPVVYLPTVIRKGGYTSKRLPKLGFAPAGYFHCKVDVERFTLEYTSTRQSYETSTTRFQTTFERSKAAGSTHVPVVPPMYVPEKGLDNHFVVWEAEWVVTNHEPEPIDPALLKRIGGNFYELKAVWDLTALEAMALAAHE